MKNMGSLVIDRSPVKRGCFFFFFYFYLVYENQRQRVTYRMTLHNIIFIQTFYRKLSSVHFAMFDETKLAFAMSVKLEDADCIPSISYFVKHNL